MTSNFWKWLSRANARVALLVGVIAFIVALGYWTWRELAQAQPAAAFNGPTTAGPGDITNKVELLAYIRSQAENQEKAANNPFYKKPVWRPEVPVAPPDNTVQPRPPSNPNPRPPSNPTPRPPPPPPPPKEIAVVYRGVMTRPDGTLAALIENQDTQKQKFFAAGEEFLATKVEGIGKDAVTLRRKDGSTLVLPRGEVGKLREN